jgi:YidC/Oxa1 family membrane protein insertase
MQKLYAEAKFNPLAGCLPMIIQLPIFFALFQVLREMEGRDLAGSYSFYDIIPSLIMSPAGSFEGGIGTFVPYLILMIIFAGATFLPMILQQRHNFGTAQGKQTLIMSGVMSVFMLFISWTMPAGVLLFWGTSGIIQVAQQQISMSIFRRRDREAEAMIEVEAIEVDVVRKQKKPRPTKKGK